MTTGAQSDSFFFFAKPMKHKKCKLAVCKIPIGVFTEHAAHKLNLVMSVVCPCPFSLGNYMNIYHLPIYTARCINLQVN